MARLGCRGVAGVASWKVSVWGCPASDCPSPTPCWLEAVGIRHCWGQALRGDSDDQEELPVPDLAVPTRTAPWAAGTFVLPHPEDTGGVAQLSMT